VKSAASLIRYDAVVRQIATGNVQKAIELLTPSELYIVGQALGGPMLEGDPGGQTLAHLRTQVPDQVSPQAISAVWGTVKPTLTNSYRPELLNLKTFPALMGYSSRIMAESWESNQLYWAQIADEMGVRPAEMAVLVPNWTQLTVERIFASHLEDWPALLRSLRSVGEDALAGKLKETARN